MSKIKHYTIICEPSKFDEEFKKFSELANPKEVKITHEGNAHYILYKSQPTIVICCDEEDDVLY